MNEPRHYIFAVKQGSPFGSDTYTLYHYQTKAEAVNVRRGFASTRQKGWVGEPSPVMKGDIKHAYYGGI